MSAVAERAVQAGRWRRAAGEYLGILVGAAVTAVALDWFLVPNRIAAGGVSGLATITYHLFGWPVGITMLALNVPLFLAGLWAIGLRFGVKTLVGTVATSLFIDAFAPYLRPITQDPLLASIYGGLIAGLGLGITFRFGGSTGGTDMAARLIQRLSTLSVGSALLAVDGAVIFASAIAFDPEVALYALISVFITTKTIDLVQVGEAYAQAAFIISEKAEEIGSAILNDLERGATSLSGRGLYTGAKREVLFVIVGRHEIQALRKLVRAIDPGAFVAITDVSDVLGEGFGEMGPP